MSALVSVICISYNHGPFVKKALESLFSQTYDSIEIIILDDASKDNSVAQIDQTIGDRIVKRIYHKHNLGYTKTFNEGLSHCNGEYIIDFALDDVMKPNFIERSIQAFESSNVQTGVVFSNADYIDAQDHVIDNHNELLLKKGMIKEVPSGKVFEWVLKRYFICTPTMVIKKEVFDRLSGYDESLAYEDFDFWVRSSRYWQYAFIDEVLLQKRKLKNSMSSQRYAHHFNEQMSSVFKVCQKAFHLCKNRNEFKALHERINYEYRQCIRTGNVSLANKYRYLMRETGGRLRFWSRLAKYLNSSMLNVMK